MAVLVMEVVLVMPQALVVVMPQASEQVVKLEKGLAAKLGSVAVQFVQRPIAHPDQLRSKRPMVPPPHQWLLLLPRLFQCLLSNPSRLPDHVSSSRSCDP
jgi:hypothetical protein